MPGEIKLKVVSPERALVDTETDEVQVPGLNGYLGILPGHAPLVSELSTGRLSYTSRGHRESIAVAGGFVEVLSDQVRVLATVAEGRKDIDVERARRALQRAEERLSGGDDDTDYERARAAASRASTRLSVAAGSD